MIHFGVLSWTRTIEDTDRGSDRKQNPAAETRQSWPGQESGLTELFQLIHVNIRQLSPRTRFMFQSNAVGVRNCVHEIVYYISSLCIFRILRIVYLSFVLEDVFNRMLADVLGAEFPLQHPCP